jgi:Alpha/beta hydrolase of unknown function (DUF900)
MLKLIWTPGAAAAPDKDRYKRAIDTLTASYGDQTAEARFPRDGAAPISGLDELAGVTKTWLGARTVPSAAAKLMLHGYAYDPRHVGDPAFDPFTLVYAYPGPGGPNARLSWLPLVEECDDRGSRRQETAIAFAWVSTGSLAEYAAAGWSESYEYACVDLARLAAQALAAVLGILAAENVQVDVLAHSLGTRLFTQTVAALGGTDGPLNNVILLDGAEYSVDAAATFAGHQFNVVNVTNEVDAVLAAGGEQLGDPSRVPGSIVACSLGRYALGTPVSWNGVATYPPNWVDISLDRRDLQAWFKANGGYTLTPTASDNVHPTGNMNHWACYTEIGNRAWVTDLLWKPLLNGGTLARTAGLPKGVLSSSQPVFAGVGIPQTTPMTMAARIRYQQGANAGGGVG